MANLVAAIVGGVVLFVLILHAFMLPHPDQIHCGLPWHCFTMYSAASIFATHAGFSSAVI